MAQQVKKTRKRRKAKKAGASKPGRYVEFGVTARVPDPRRPPRKAKRKH